MIYVVALLGILVASIMVDRDAFDFATLVLLLTAVIVLLGIYDEVRKLRQK